MRIFGAIDRLDATAVEGWLSCPDHPTEKFTLELVLHGVVVALGSADVFRADLKHAQLGDGFCAFSLPTPTYLPATDVAQLQVRIQGSPLCFTKSTANGAHGEAVDKYARFGGPWIDAPDFMDRLGQQHRDGLLSDALCDSLVRFVRDGYVVLPQAVAPELVEQLNRDIAHAWQSPPPGLRVETFEPKGKLRVVAPALSLREGRTKLLDLHAYLASARAAIANPAAIAFLTAIFGDAPQAFQSLAFWRGSQQALHKDTAYVKIDDSPMTLAASWLALEDVQPGSGELEYLVGSHRAPHYLFGGTHKWMENHPEEDERFLASIQGDAERFGHARAAFLARAGDVLIWHADLAHGGSPITHPTATRRSLVTHFTATRCEPYYRRAHRYATHVEDTCAFVSQYGPVEPIATRTLRPRRKNARP